MKARCCCVLTFLSRWPEPLSFSFSVTAVDSRLPHEQKCVKWRDVGVTLRGHRVCCWQLLVVHQSAALWAVAIKK
jgi:hypothetical protein